MTVTLFRTLIIILAVVLAVCTGCATTAPVGSASATQDNSSAGIEENSAAIGGKSAGNVYAWSQPKAGSVVADNWARALAIFQEVPLSAITSSLVRG